MKTWEHRFVTAGVALTGLLFLVAAVKPALINDLPLNATFLIFGAVVLGLGIVLWRRGGRS